jgi:hypothetical protein
MLLTVSRLRGRAMVRCDRRNSESHAARFGPPRELMGEWTPYRILCRAERRGMLI